MEINTDNKVVSIDKVIPNDYNPKLDFHDHPENGKEYGKIKASLQKIGQIQPILVRELENGLYEIINGFHRWSAMKELGYSEVEIKNLGKLNFDDAVSQALLTEDTKVPIDNIELAKLLSQVVTEEKPIEYWTGKLPYSEEEIRNKMDMLNFDFDNFTSNELEMKEVEEDDTNTIEEAVDAPTFEKIKAIVDAFTDPPDGNNEIRIRNVKRVKMSRPVYERMLAYIESEQAEGKSIDEMFKELLAFPSNE